MSSASNHHTGDHTPSDSASPRAFATGTGFVLQTVGVFLACSSCCVWSLSSHLLEPSAEAEPSWLHFLYGERQPAALLACAMAASLVGGIALLAVGAGLQAERPASGRHAMIVTGAMTATYLCIAGVLLFKSGAPIAAATAGILGVLSLLLFMLAGHSAAVLRAHPPRDNGTLARDLDRELTDRRTRVLDDPDA